MQSISIIYAYRNRERKRIKNSLESLSNQTNKKFEVVFVDYGSDEIYASKIKTEVESFSFASYHYIAHPGLLWNKSKALNYATLKAKGDFVFIADVDICFDKTAIENMHQLANKNKFNLFKLTYLKDTVQQTAIQKVNFTDSDIKHHGWVNGMVLVSKEAFFEVSGYDEFYHFYGSEDVDLYQRLTNLGIQKQENEKTLFYHQWHPIYNSIDDSILEKNPRFFNIKRINQQHFFYQKKENTIYPVLHQNTNEKIWYKKDRLYPEDAEISFSIKNDHAKVWHLLEIVLPNFKHTIVQIVVEEDEYFDSIKFKIKKKLKKSDRVPISMKEVNDLFLKQILLKYRDYNYSYRISDSLRQICFIIKI